MKRFTILGLAALTVGTGVSLAQDFGADPYAGEQQPPPGFFGLDSAPQAPGLDARRGHRGRHGGPGFRGFVLGGESGYGLISIHLRPPGRPEGAEYGPDTQYLDTPDYTSDVAQRPRFEGMVRVNGQAYRVVNLQRERVGGDAYDPASGDTEYLGGEASPEPQRREIARIMADLVPMRRHRPEAGTEGSWPGSWMNDAAGEVAEAPTGRIQGTLVAFGSTFQEEAGSQGFAQGRRRRGHRGGGLIFEGQIVTETTSGQVLARMSGPSWRGGRRGQGGGFGQGGSFGQGDDFGQGGGQYPPPPPPAASAIPDDGDLF